MKEGPLQAGLGSKAKMRLIDARTTDGSRQFARLRKGATLQALRDHAALLPGLSIVSCFPGHADAGWFEFTYRGHSFAVRNGGSAYCFFVKDPRCPDISLYQVACHCEQLLAGAPNE
jgi:hypothetical protein